MTEEDSPVRPRPGQTTFLVVYDYGTGGIWMYIHARSADEIRERFPGLTVITQWRDWMTPERLVPVIWNNRAYDLDNPTGWLATYASEAGTDSPPPNR